MGSIILTIILWKIISRINIIEIICCLQAQLWTSLPMPKMSPMIEDLVLLNVVREIDSRLPAHIRTHYTHKMSKSERLMDFKNDIMNNVDKLMQELDKEESLASIHSVGVPRLAWIKQHRLRQPT